MLCWHSKSYFNIRTKSENPILTFVLRPNILFWHSKSYFDITTEAEYCILTFKILFWTSSRIILFWQSKCYLDIRAESGYPILTFKILFWHSHWGRKSYFDIQYIVSTARLQLGVTEGAVPGHVHETADVSMVILFAICYNYSCTCHICTVAMLIRSIKYYQFFKQKR